MCVSAEFRVGVGEGFRFAPKSQAQPRSCTRRRVGRCSALILLLHFRQKNGFVQRRFEIEQAHRAGARMAATRSGRS